VLLILNFIEDKIKKIRMSGFDAVEELQEVKMCRIRLTHPVLIKHPITVDCYQKKLI